MEGVKVKNRDEMMRVKNHRVGAPPLSDTRVSKWRTHMLGIDCVLCNSRQNIWVPTTTFWNWKRGEGHIQNLMPELNSEEREALIMNWCLSCVKSIYAGMEEQMDEQLEEEDNNAT